MKLRLREDLLHYIWQIHAFDQSDLRTSEGKSIEILSFGVHNMNAGPDFLNGKVEIDGTIWAGHIELHLKSSDWSRHKHGADPQYQNVVLHVVYHDDQEIKLQDGTLIPCLSLESRIDSSLLKGYEHLMSNRLWVPCEQHLSSINDLTKLTTIDRQLADRLELKTSHLAAELDSLNGDLSALIYRQLAWALGLSVNGEAMKLLMVSLPYSIIQKHRDDLFQLEALLFGQSGMLETVKEDDYVGSLKREYQVLQRKFGLIPMTATHWKYLRLRPAAFPSIRIAQLAKLLHEVDRLDELLLNGSTTDISAALKVKAEGYWKYHYTWGTPSSPRAKSLGKSKREIIIINAVAPILWFYGKQRGQQRLKDKAIEILESLPAEKNYVIDRWKSVGFAVANAAESQGLLQLKKQYCDKQLCLQCPIGHTILSRT